MRIRTTTLTERARELRRNSSYVEWYLWERLRARRLDGVKFRRQHPIGNFVVDFFCIEKKLVIELDGEEHVDSVEADARRTSVLERAGCRVLRFQNGDVIEDIDSVIDKIRYELRR